MIHSRILFSWHSAARCVSLVAVRNDINHTTALVTNVTTTSITVQWTSAADVPNGLENYYQFNVVVYNELFSGSHITAGEVRATSHPTEVTVSGLIARTRYTLKANIVAYGANYGSYSVILSVETLARGKLGLKFVYLKKKHRRY